MNFIQYKSAGALKLIFKFKTIANMKEGNKDD